MPDWLFEGRLEIYIGLAAAASIFLIVWCRDRKRRWLIGIGVVAALTVLYLVLDFAVETDGEEIGRRLQEASRAVRKRDADGAFSILADDFSFEGKNKKTFEEYAAPYITGNGSVSDVVIWEYRYLGKTNEVPPIANVTFRVKVKGTLGGMERGFAFCEAQFERDPTRGWRLKGFRLLDPMHNNEPIK